MKRPEEGGEVDPAEIFSKMFGGGEHGSSSSHVHVRADACERGVL
jgi:hypothetical protein